MTATLVRDLIADLRPIRRPARVLYAGAAFWLASGLVHLGVLAADGWAWSGAVSCRKPLVFSVSVGLLLATVGWVLDRLPDRPRLAGALSWALLVSSTVEVGLIALQAWRGRASHFNTLAAGDALIFAAMGIMVAVMSLCLVAVLAWSLVERPRDPLVRLAVIGGMALVVSGLGIGQWIVELGNDFVETHRAVPDTVVYGQRGVAKFPHAVAFHGIQAFIVAAVALRRGVLAEAARRRVLRLVVWSYVAALVFASAQTVTGRAPLDPSIWSLGLALSLAALAAGLVRIGRALPAGRDRSRSPAEALTNTMKHAGAGSASVRVQVGEAGLELRVSDDGHGDPERLHPGRGILGMPERAAMHGGRVSLDRDARAASRLRPPGLGARSVIRILLVDDDQLMRARLRLIIEQTPDLRVRGEAADGRQAVEAARRERPDVVVMDVRMPVMDGIEATRQITGAPHPPKVLILTTFELDEYVFSALQAGASGFLLKRSPPEQLVGGIRTVAAGEALLSPSVTRRLIEAFSSRPCRRDNPRFADMTDREREVLVAIARGLSNEELAEELFISENTVKTHVKRVLTKLGARDRVQAVVMAYEGGLMDR